MNICICVFLGQYCVLSKQSIHLDVYTPMCTPDDTKQKALMLTARYDVGCTQRAGQWNAVLSTKTSQRSSHRSGPTDWQKQGLLWPQDAQQMLVIQQNSKQFLIHYVTLKVTHFSYKRCISTDADRMLRHMYGSFSSDCSHEELLIWALQSEPNLLDLRYCLTWLHWTQNTGRPTHPPNTHVYLPVKALE